MPGLFRAHEVLATKIPTYFIESTAPDNVDDAPTPAAAIPGLSPIDADDAIDEIASHLSGADQPNLVVMVHGFNNPQPDVLRMYDGASRAIEGDAFISKQKGLVCVGYRWPSENILAPLRSCRAALPTLPRWVFWFGVILGICGLIAMAARFLSNAQYPDLALVTGHVLIVIGLAASGLVLCALLLRIIVYFRDTYRATNYGVPDLIEIIRQIDRKIIAHDRSGRGGAEAALHHRRANRVQLSFVGHSMGGYVVTNAIRALTDLFAPDSLRPSLNTGIFSDANDSAKFGENNPWEVAPTIGDAFNLTRFVLASPDIPAEALLSNRANFLASSLRRFREAYLFSNEGDEVLRQVSTMANYFSFPTKSSKFGFRLGNVEILRSEYGIIPLAPDSLLTTLRIGYCTLQGLYSALREGRSEQNKAYFQTVQNRLPEVFSYFDCTDYIEPDAHGVDRGLLTFALRIKVKNPKARMRWTQHFRLLWAYCVHHQNPDVHGGYFKGALSQQLIYRLACLGFDHTAAAFGGLRSMSAKCNQKQIRVVLSPVLQGKSAIARDQFRTLAS
jgi:hypothetical protein